VIVVDEHLQAPAILTALEPWYQGRVVSITGLRPGTVIKDDAIPHLLRRHRQPTFVTINVSDFWRSVRPNRGYCIITFDLSGRRVLELPELARRLFQLPEFSTRSARMGKIARVSMRVVEYYDAVGPVESFIWSDG
jgi:hypothetical protein